MGNEKILLIDDRRDNVETLAALLAGHGYAVHSNAGADEALNSVHALSPDLILLAARGNSFEGYELCSRLKQDRATRNTPIIFLDPADRAQVFAAGGADYLTSPLLEEEVLVRVKAHLRLRALHLEVDDRDARWERTSAGRPQVEAERDMLRDALREAEEKGQDLIENLSEVIYVFDQDGILIYISPAVESFLGYRPVEVNGRHFGEFAHPDDLPRIADSFQQVLAGHPSAQEYRALTKSGEVRWMRTSSQPVRREGRITGVQGVLVDITAYKEVEQALERLSHDLGERVKELDCLYSISALAARPDLSLEEVFERMVALIPPGFLHPDITGARIAWKGREFRTPNFAETPWSLEADLVVHDRRVGGLKVCYLATLPEQARSPFLCEERDLVDAIAGRLANTIERIEVEEQLRHQNEFLMHVLESLTHPFCVVDPRDYSVQIANSAARAEDASGGTTCYALTHGRNIPCDTADHPCPLEEIKRTREPAMVEHIHLDQDGHPRNVEVYGYPVLDAEGNLARVIEYSLDITERKRAEEGQREALAEATRVTRALRQSEGRYRQLLDALQEGIWVIDQDANTTFVNPRMAEMLGYTVDEMVGQHLYSFMDERGVEITKRNLERRAQGIREQHEFEFLRKDGSRIFTLLEASPIYDEGRHYTGSIAGIQDITARRQAEQALLAAKEEAERARQEEVERRQEAERRRHIAESLTGILAALNSGLPLDQIHDHIAMRASQLLENQAAVLYRLADLEETLVVEAAKGVPQSWLEASVDLPEQGAIVQALSLCQPLAISDLLEEPGEARPPVTGGTGMGSGVVDGGSFRAMLAVPVVVKGEVYGGLVLYYTEPHVFDEELDLALAFSDQTALAIENARLREQVERVAVSAERNRLARDLHDSVTQALFSASLVAEVLPHVWQRDPGEALQGLVELRRLTRAALSEMRTMLLELRPTALLETDLNDLLAQLAEALTGRVQLQVSLELEQIPTLPPDVHVTFYRVAQEALNNVVKHGAARNMIVSLRASPPLAVQPPEQWQGQVILHVSDDGQGFRPDTVGQEHLGLEIMRERARSVGAVLTVDSQPGQGTQVSLVWQKGSQVAARKWWAPFPPRERQGERND